MLSQSADSPWYAVQTKPLREGTAVRNLRQQGIDTIMPLERHKTIRRGVVRECIRPRFRRYVFAAIASHQFPAVRSTIGVSHVVRFAGMPVPIPSDIILELEGISTESGAVDSRDCVALPRIGDVVPMSAESVLRDLVAEIVGVVSHEKIRVWLRDPHGNRRSATVALSDLDF